MAKHARHLRSSLQAPDSPTLRHLPDYSPDLAIALNRAYRSIQRGEQDPDEYWKAFITLHPFRKEHVCAGQRLHLEYALALIYAGEGDWQLALACLDNAWELSVHLHDWAAQVELGYLAGSLLQMQAYYSEAYELYATALESLRSLECGNGPIDPIFELDLVLRLAWGAWELGLFPTSLRHLDDAYRLRAQWAPDAADEAASLAWLDAQLSRVRGHPMRALQQSSAAANLLLTHGKPVNAGRCHIILAECAFDVVELAHGTGSPHSFIDRFGAEKNMHLPTHLDPLSFGRASAERGLAFAQAAEDHVGVAMARLAIVRSIRLGARTGRTIAGVAGAEAVIRTARHLGDISLLGRAQTALGDELAAMGRTDSARLTYYRAVCLLDEHQLGGLGFWPRHALLRTSEDDE